MSSDTILASAKKKSRRSKSSTGRPVGSTTPPARRRFGQHFLEPAWVEKVVGAIGPASDQVILEVGPGRGALTRALAPSVAAVLAIEVDRDLAGALRRSKLPRVDIVEADFLRLDLAELAARADRDDAVLRLVGNLPYNVGTPIVLRLLREASAAGLVDAVVMLQREVAVRLVAPPDSRDYGPLAILTALRAEPRRLLDLPPGAFRPAPKVKSSLVSLRFREADRRPTRPQLFEAMVRAVFTQRRKQLLNTLAPFAGLSRDEVAVRCGRAGIDPTRRPGSLTLPELIDLSEVLPKEPLGM